MLKRKSKAFDAIFAVMAFMLFAVAAWVGAAHAGLGGGIGFGAGQGLFNNVGGVSIDPQGVLRDVARETRAEARNNPERLAGDVPEGMEEKTKLRKFSLRALQEAIKKVRDEPGLGELPEDTRYMGGIQRIQYVFVYPEDNDIVLAGPAEGWRVDELGNVVGQTTGRPVVHLSDFVTALRSTMQPNPQVFSCSIDPKPENVQRMRQLVSKLPPVRNADQVARKIEEAMGMQTIRISGIDPTSSFAWTMAAADYRMKRLAMGFEPAPVKGLSSFLDMIGTKRPANMMPRWWLEADYDALLTDGKGLAWELRGQGVKCMTEDEVVADDGTRRGSGQADPIAKKWADAMTKNYDELSAKSAIFGHLRNCMDVSVICALIATEGLDEKAGLDLGVLLSDDTLPVRKLSPPKEVPSQVSYRQVRGQVILTVSGGVTINPWKFARTHEENKSLLPLRDDAIAPAGASWWWN